MKIGDNGFLPGAKDDLLARLRRARERARLQGDDVRENQNLGSVVSIDRARGLERAEAGGPPELQERLLETASAALEGRFEDSKSLRAAVVEIIVDTRYGSGLARSERARLVQTLQQTLVDDPEFKAEVDHMLVLAARELAAPQG